MINVSFHNMSKNTFTIDLEKLTSEEREIFFRLLQKGDPTDYQPILEKTNEVEKQ